MATAKKGIDTNAVAATAVGAAAAAALAAAGAYWFYGAKDAAKHRKSARSWMLRARAEVMEAVEGAVKSAGEIDKEAYMDIVEGVLARYSKLAGVSAVEMQQVTRDMKEVWQHMQKAHKGASPKKIAKKAVKTAKKAVKKATKKA